MLKIQNLSFSYSLHAPIFTQLSLSVAEGEIIHVAGPNGVGKSTLLGLVAGFILPQSGSIERSANMEYLSADGNGLFLKLSAIDNLSFWAKIIGNLELVEVALKIWGLSDPYVQKHLPVEKFSTGMRRRLALARLSISKAKFFILDEPTVGLDANGIAAFISFIQTQQKAGCSILLSCHDATFLKEISITQTLRLS